MPLQTTADPSHASTIHPMAIVLAMLLHIGAGAVLLRWHQQAPPPVTSFSIELPADPIAAPEAAPQAAAEPPHAAPDPPPQTPLEATPEPPSPEAPPTLTESPQMALTPPVVESPLAVPDKAQAEADTAKLEKTVPALPRPPLPAPPKHLAASRTRPPPVTAQPPSLPDATRTPATTDAPPLSQPVSPTWQGSLSAWLLGHRIYPEAARRRGDQGTVVVRFTVGRDGAVADVTLVRSSLSENLDEAALTMLRGASVPPFPASMTQASITITVPIHFILEH